MALTWTIDIPRKFFYFLFFCSSPGAAAVTDLYQNRQCCLLQAGEGAGEPTAEPPPPPAAPLLRWPCLDPATTATGCGASGAHRSTAFWTQHRNGEGASPPTIWCQLFTSPQHMPWVLRETGVRRAVLFGTFCSVSSQSPPTTLGPRACAQRDLNRAALFLSRICCWAETGSQISGCVLTLLGTCTQRDHRKSFVMSKSRQGTPQNPPSKSLGFPQNAHPCPGGPLRERRSKTEVKFPGLLVQRMTFHQQTSLWGKVSFPSLTPST